MRTGSAVSSKTKLQSNLESARNENPLGRNSEQMRSVHRGQMHFAEIAPNSVASHQGTI